VLCVVGVVIGLSVVFGHPVNVPVVTCEQTVRTRRTGGQAAGAWGPAGPEPHALPGHRVTRTPAVRRRRPRSTGRTRSRRAPWPRRPTEPRHGWRRCP